MSLFGPDLGGDRLEHRADVRPGGGAASGHQAGALQRALFAAGNAASDEQHPQRLDLLRAPFGVEVVGVAAVDDDVARREMRPHLLDQLVDRRSGLDQHHQLARALHRRDQLRDRVATLEVAAGGAAAHERVDAVGRPVVNGHPVAAALHVQGEVLAHDGQADQTEIAVAHRDALSSRSMRRDSREPCGDGLRARALSPGGAWPTRAPRAAPGVLA